MTRSVMAKWDLLDTIEIGDYDDMPDGYYARDGRKILGNDPRLCGDPKSPKNQFAFSYHYARYALRIIDPEEHELGGILGDMRSLEYPGFKDASANMISDIADHFIMNDVLYDYPINTAVIRSLNATGRYSNSLIDLLNRIKNNPYDYK